MAKSYDELEPWQRRVCDELGELQDKVDKLTTFCASDSFDSLDVVQQGLLMTQLNVMRAYQGVLALRVYYFGLEVKSSS